MPVRKLSLEEWFMIHAQHLIARQHFFVPGSFKVDVSHWSRKYGARRVPYTALVIKALGMAGHRFPQLNRMVFHSPFGYRVLEFDRVRVNLPVLVKEGGRATVKQLRIEDAHLKSAAEIQAEIRAAKRPAASGSAAGGKQDPIARLLRDGGNNLWNRSLLKLFLALLQAFPERFVGATGTGLSVSSLHGLMSSSPDGIYSAYGPNALTLSIASVRAQPDGQVTLQIGIGYDHLALRGDEVYRANVYLHDLLSGADPGLE